MTTPTPRVAEILDLFRSEDPTGRLGFIESVPACRMTDDARMAAGIEMPEMRVQALDFLASGYALDGPFDLGSAVAEACFRLAQDACRQHGPGTANTYVLAGGRAVNSWATSLQREGKHEESTGAVRQGVDWLESVGDRTNINSLFLKGVDAEIELQNYDAAEKFLALVRESDLAPMEQVTFRAARQRLDQYRGGGTVLPGEVKHNPRAAFRKMFTGREPDTDPPDFTKEEMDKIVGSLDEVVGRFAGAESDIAIRQKIVSLSRVFTDPVKARDPATLDRTAQELEPLCAWMRDHGFTDTENDALWSLHLCYKRTDRPELAVDRLTTLWRNSEKARGGFADPTERARLATRFQYLYPELCVLLQKLGRTKELIAAIESSKGRILADILTQQRGRIEPDEQFRKAVDGLQELMKKAGAHYLTFLVDDDQSIAGLVAKDGRLHSAVIPLGKEALRDVIRYSDPSKWGRPDPHNPLEARIPADLPDRLAPLVQWLEPLDVLADGDHVCWSPDEMLHALPLQYVTFRGAPLAKYVSVSRIHGANVLASILGAAPRRYDRSVAVEIPATQDLENKGKLKAFGQAGSWLQERLGGDVLRGTKADTDAFVRLPMKHALVHIASHGTFPVKEQAGRDPNPFRSSGLLMAEDGKLPDLATIGTGKGLLTPEQVLATDLDLSQSHLTLQACVSGLAKEGIGGDALGLEWALLQRGASSILSTHWDVSTRTTARFCVTFYKHWIEEGRSRADAWHETVREFMDSGAEEAHPYHWAAFSLSGDWR